MMEHEVMEYYIFNDGMWSATLPAKHCTKTGPDQWHANMLVGYVCV